MATKIHPPQIFANSGAGTVLTSTGVGADPVWAVVPASPGATNLTYTSAANQGTVNSDTGTDAVIPAATAAIAGLFLPADFTKLASYPATYAPSPTNLTYTSSASQGVVVSDTGTDAVIPAATAAIAGLMLPADFSKLASYPAVYAAPVDNLSYTASPTNGIVAGQLGTDATIPLVDATNSGLMSPADFTKLAAYPPTPAAGATNLTYTAAPTQGTVNSDTGTDAVIPVVDAVNAGLATPAMLAASLSYKTTITSATTNTVTHSLNTLDVMVELYNTVSGQSIIPDVTSRTVNAFVLAFDPAMVGLSVRVLVRAV
jgi:hypothetical protein